MSKMKKIIVEVIAILLVVLLIGMNVKVLATGDSNNPIDLSGNIDLLFDNQQPDTTNTTNTAPVEVPNTTTTPNILQPSTTNSAENTELPKTGVTEDITVMCFIIVCVIAAIFAYKKIRDYNV